MSITTSALHLGSAIHPSETGSSVAHYFSKTNLKQSDILIPLLNKLLNSKKIELERIKAVAVDIGPGSFTGVRVGVAVARALAQALSIPLIGIISLEALAFQSGKKAKAIAVSLPALKNEIYFAAYERQGDSLIELITPQWGAATGFTEKIWSLKKKFKTIVHLNGEAPVRPESIARLAIQKFFDSKYEHDFNRVEPLYLQPTWAERSIKEGVHA